MKDYEDEAFDDIERAQQRKVATGMTDGSGWRKRQIAEQGEPVAGEWILQSEPYGYFRYDIRLDAWVQSRDSDKGVAFYTTPQQRTWVELTDEERETILKKSSTYTWKAIELVEAKLKQKNGFAEENT